MKSHALLMIKRSLPNWLLLLILLFGCHHPDSKKSLSVYIDGPFMDLDEGIYYKEVSWYKLNLENTSNTTVYTPAFSGRLQEYHPYSTAYHFNKDSIRTTLSDRFSDTLIPLFANQERVFLFAIQELPEKPMDSLVLFFHYYPDTSLHNQKIMEVSCRVGDNHALKVFSCR